MRDGLLEVKGDTIIECLQKCRQYEKDFEYVTKIHEVKISKNQYRYTPDKRVKKHYAGMSFQKYYRAFMRLKPYEVDKMQDAN